MAALFKGVLSGPKSFDSAAPISLRFELANVGNSDCRVLVWFTPLEGLNSDCLSIRRNGQTKVPYDGPILKRGNPQPKDYILLRAGQTISADIDVGDAYAVGRPAKYQVALNLAGLESSGAKARLSSAIRADSSPKSRVSTTRVEFKVTPGNGWRTTRGHRARQESQELAPVISRAETTRSAATGPRAPKFLGGTPAQHAQLTRAHRDGFDLCVAAFSNLAESDRYRAWFGSPSRIRFSKVRNTYAQIIDRMQSRTYVYDLRSDRCPRAAFGYTFKNSTIIWLCSGFWNASALGMDSKAGTIIHEHSHCDSRTEDLTFGQIRARSLAIDSPGKAVKNADNYEYYACDVDETASQPMKSDVKTSVESR